MNGAQAWAVLALGVAAYEVLARDGELMSEAVDRALVAHPILTYTAIGITACHLANLLPPRVDPFVLSLCGVTYVKQKVRHRVFSV